jgi:hypothetical protein
MRMVVGNFLGIVADKFPRDGVRHPGGFELGRGGMPQ